MTITTHLRPSQEILDTSIFMLTSHTFGTELSPRDCADLARKYSSVTWSSKTARMRTSLRRIRLRSKMYPMITTRRRKKMKVANKSRNKRL